MLLRFQCPACLHTLEADASLSGNQAECPQCGKPVAIPAPQITAGTTVGGLRLERLLGKGGMGEVYLAEQLSVERQVAVKILPPGFAENEPAVHRFLHEGRLAARLDHANIVTVYEAGEDNDYYYLAMAYVDGETLGQRLARQGALPELEALAVARAVADALAYAWDEAALLHRDIKPANIMMDRRGRIFLMDLGLAKSLGDDSGLTASGQIMGTPLYMSPEQAMGVSELGVQTDMYGLGATLYHLTTGVAPFTGDSALAILAQHASAPLPPAREKNPALSEACAHLLDAMLAKDPAARYPTWEDLIADIDRVLSGEAPKRARPRRAGGRTDTARAQAELARRAREMQARSADAEPRGAISAPGAGRRRRVVAIGLAAAAVLAVALGGLYLWRGRSRPPRAVAVSAKPAVDENLHDHKAQEAVPHTAASRAATVEPATTAAPVASAKALPPAPAADVEAASPASEPARSGPPAPVATDTPAADTATAAAGAPMTKVADAAPPAAAPAPAAAAFDALLDKVAADFAAQRFDAGLRGWQTGRRAAELEGLAEQVDAVSKTIEAVARMPERILQSLRADIDKTVTVELRSGRGEFEIREVTGTTVKAMVLVGQGKLGRTFTLADLSLRERLKRIGEGQAPELLLMRGILALEAGRADIARTLFDQVGGALGAAFGRGLERREAAAAEGRAEAARRDLLRTIAKSTASLEPKVLIPSIRAKCTSGEQAKRTRELVAAFGENYGASAAAKQVLPTIEKALRFPFRGADWTVPDLGMAFVWIPALDCWVGKYEVTNAQYRRFRAAHDSGIPGTRFGFISMNGERQPAVRLNFADATEFATWLTDREKQEERLSAGLRYRLPTSAEWAVFAQCGDGRTYPWGNEWPPTHGNYAGEEVKGMKVPGLISGYGDGSFLTCPVEESGRNDWGLFGVGGNVWEWMAKGNTAKCDGICGASYYDYQEGLLRCSYRRFIRDPTIRTLSTTGFRLVLAGDGR